MFVVDASVHVADMRPSEPQHREARAFLDFVRQSGAEAYGPIILLAEVAAGIARGTGRPELAQKLTTLMQGTPNFSFIPVDESLGILASDIAATHQIRGCDAVYVALAQRMAIPLVTLDGEQRERAPSVVVAQTPAATLSAIMRQDDEQEQRR